jgi:hypothetical protein
MKSKSMKLRIVSLATLFCLLLSISNWVPNTHQAQGSTAPQTRTVFRTYAPFWKVNDGYSSTIVVRNMDRQSSVSATPILFTSDSKQLRLAPIQLAPNSVKKISLEDALKELPDAPDSGALALEFDNPQLASVIGEAVVTNYKEGIIFDFPLHSGYVGDEAKALHTSWWLPDEKTEGRVVLFNTSDKKVVVHPSLTANWTQQPGNDVSLAAHEVKTVDLRDLLHQSGMRDADVGSLTLAYDGPAHALLPALLLFNEKTGFSLTGKFFAKQPQQADTSAVTDWRFPAVFAGSADPGLGFKRGMKLTPYALVSNATNNPIAADMQVSFEVPGSLTTQSLSLPSILLGPMETRLVDLSEYVTRDMKDVSNFSLRLSHPGPPGGLGVHIFSTDQSRKFVFTAEGATHGSPVVDSVYWNIAGDLQSLLAVQNVGNRELEVRVKLRYSVGGGQGMYKLPLMRLAAQANKVINLREVIGSGKADESGQVIPPGVSFGTATVEAADGQGSGALVGGSVAFDPDSGKYGWFFLPLCSPQGITFFLDGIELLPCDDFFIIITPVVICTFACGGGDVPPSVLISGPNAVPLGTDVNTIQLTATGTPAGGTYLWSTTSSLVTLTNTSSATVTVRSVSQSASANDVTINLAYTVNVQTAHTLTTLTVQKPTSLFLLATTYQGTPHFPFTCASGSTGWERDVGWQVLDQFGSPMQFANMSASDTITLGQPNTCGASGALIGTANTDSSGQFRDSYSFCSPGCTGAGCQLQASQSWVVNGISLASPISAFYTCTSITLNGQ